MTYDTINDAVTMQPEAEGTLLAGRYRVVRQLGQGGMGLVWLAEDTQLDGKLFAIKMLPSILVSNKRAYRQLKDEALVAMQLVHPNIVQIRAFEENNGNPFLVMDYVDGETLDDYLAEHCEDVDHVEHVERVGGVARTPAAPSTDERSPDRIRLRRGFGGQEEREGRKGVGKAIACLVLLAALGGGGCYAWTKHEESVKRAAEQERKVNQDATRKKVQLWEGGPYWADRNIGAEEPWASGYYFWWGDTVGYKRVNDDWVSSDGSRRGFSFGAENVPTYVKSISELRSEGWITVDGVLVPEHDAAHIQWGGGWRMPTKQELSDLDKKCDWTWTTLKGVNGYEVRGRGDFVSNSIFLPAAGYGYGTSLYYAGSYGYYWSSVSYSGSSYGSWYLGFSSGGHLTRSSSRIYGFSVRPVQGFTK